MKQEQIQVYKKMDGSDNHILIKIMKHCKLDEVTGQFKCKTHNCPVYIDLSRNYVFCAVHGRI